MTPEGAIKREIDKMLEVASVHVPLWWYKPVQTGYGKRVIDYIGCRRGVFFGIEAKAPDEYLTSFQSITAKSILEAGGTVWVISTFETVDQFGHWLMKR